MKKDGTLWWRDGVIYQIYPRSFADSNDDGIGDLPGIISRLDYLQDLGVDAIWLSPIYPSPDRDFGYDVADYTEIDPKFGTLEDFDRLVEEAHRRGIRVVLDLVLNHTSDQHEWFRQARSSVENPHHDWYLFRKPRPGGGPPNNWKSIFGGEGWEYVPELGEYYFHMFVREQPDVNWRNPELRKAMLNVFHFWCRRGVDGFRLDVFNAYFKHVDLPDNPRKFGLRPFDQQRHIYDVSQPEMFPLLEEIRGILDSYPERYAVGETFLAGGEEAARYCKPGLLHAAFNFDFLGCKWKPQDYLRSILRWEGVLDADSWPNYVLNNHDNRRSATRFGRGEDDERLKVAAALLLTLRGTPFLYYGEEIGMRDIRLKADEVLDPVGKRYRLIHFLVGRDGCRSPMQWDAGPNAGFSRGKPWLPVHPNHVHRNAAGQKADPESLFNFYRSLLHLRRSSQALQRGLFQALNFDPRSMLAYLRQTPEEVVLVALNFRRWPVRLVLGGELNRTGWELLLSNRREALGEIQDRTIRLLGDEALILRQR